MSSNFGTKPAIDASDRRTSKAGWRATASHKLAPYLFISPFFLLYGLFMVIPIGAAVYLSFTAWAGFGSPQWIGFHNYTQLFRDPTFLASVKNTLFYIAISLFVVVPLALMIATALNARGLRLRDLFRLIYFLPIVVSPIVIALVFSLTFDRQFGVLNTILRSLFGVGSIDWLGNEVLAKGVVAFLIVWRWTGYLVIFFLAALQNIPRSLYEAAALDGARAFAQFRNVTLPMLRPITVFVSVTVFIGSAQIFDEPYLLTQGGPANATIPVAEFIYNAAFAQQQLGYAAAAGVLFFIAVFTISKAAMVIVGIGRES
ncbi:carbohydrate ABC transporter permease [Streptomyces sp. NPDC058228]|uniref:carbohydrate ABC transporter permease n=1 Tax=Streptomyces sp. NPDC058228 TaxID=3346390 RepID=UPI0036E5B286